MGNRINAILVMACAAACGSHGPHDPPATTDDATLDPDAVQPSRDGATLHDAAILDAPRPDAFPSVLDLRIDCHNDCVLHATPPSIAVQAGTSFQVNWINVGDTDCDVAKIDQFNQVPIIIGLEPGTSYHDPVHDWCGTLFTGTFDFRVSICTLPSYIPVNCGL
ncbi:MAG: hypothetical protein ABI678_10605 [Kofleriaceae bacterium]